MPEAIRRSTATRTALLCLGFAMMLSPGDAPAQGAPAVMAIRADRVIPVSGPAIEDAVILIEGGKITEVGERGNVRIPLHAEVVDCSGGTVFPGLVSPVSTLGVKAGAAEPQTEVIEIRGRRFPVQRGGSRSTTAKNDATRIIFDELDPDPATYRGLARAGFTSIGIGIPGGNGLLCQGTVLRTAGRTMTDLCVVRPAFLQMAFRPGTASRRFLDETLRAAAGARGASGAASRPAGVEGGTSRPVETSAADGAASRPAATKEPSAALRPLVAVLDREMPGFLALDSAAAVLHFLEIAGDAGDFRPALVLDSDAWRVADRLSEKGFAAVVAPEVGIADLVRTAVNTPAILARKGIAVAFRVSGDSVAGHAEHRARVAEICRLGMPRDQALRAMTLIPAQLLGIDARVGTIEKGKDANLVIFTGDPLSPTTRIRRVYVEGRVAWDESENHE